jgi:hypothetical protein
MQSPMQHSTRSALATALIAVVEQREKADQVFLVLLQRLRLMEQEQEEEDEQYQLEGRRQQLQRITACEKEVYSAVETHCGWFDEYSLRYSQPLIEHCSPSGSLSAGKSRTALVVQLVAQHCA